MVSKVQKDIDCAYASAQGQDDEDDAAPVSPETTVGEASTTPAAPVPVAQPSYNPPVNGNTPINQWSPSPGVTPGQVANGVQTPAANAQINQANQGIVAANQELNPVPGGTPANSIRSTDAQATADVLNNLGNQQDLAHQKGEIESKEQTDLAAKQAAAAAEKIQQAKDFDTLQSANLDKYTQAHNQTQAAYDEYRKVAGTLKDPYGQFWEDRGQGSRITAALAAFSSGMGAGLTGHGGNPFMDFLNKQIDNNFQAHKQNIEDKYNSAVAAGRIEDTVENHNRFVNEAKLKSFDLSSAHIASELNQIQNSSASKVAKITAAKAVADLQQQGIAARQVLAQKEAAKGAAGLAQQRAQQKEVREAFQKAVALHNTDMGEDEARLAAVKDLLAAGYNRSLVSPIAQANGIRYVQTDLNGNEVTAEEIKKNPEAAKDIVGGGWQIPKSTSTGTMEEPHYDKEGKLIVPTKTAQGKLIPPQQQETLKKDVLERTAPVDGQPAIFKTKEDAETAKAIPGARKLLKRLTDAWNDGDKGAYDQARLEFIELGPRLLGYKRGPSSANAGESGGRNDEQDQQDRATLAGQLPEFRLTKILGVPLSKDNQAAIARGATSFGGSSEIDIAKSKLVGVGKTLNDIDADSRANLVNYKKPEKKESEDDIIKKYGGKVK